MSADGEDDRAEEGVPARFQVDLAGKLLGPYRVDRKLAEGGMGSVWLAHDTSLDQRVVVKVPHARFLAEPGFRARFRREISELVRLEHPRIVRILARGEVDDVPYFVLQYLGGGSLEDRIRREPGSSPERVLSAAPWLRAIAETLDFIHARGVVHRDVKPANILFDEAEHVFLSDFGVVKALGAREDGAVTEAGTGVGSPFYMAPEQSLGGPATGAADQYGLASTLFEAAAGEPPFGRGNVVQVLLRKQKEPAPRLGTRIPGLPAACDDALARALDADPAKRFPSCVAFADAFLAPLAPPVPSRGSRWAVVAVAALLLLGLAGVGLAAGWFRRDGPAPTTAAQRVRLVQKGSAPHRPLRYRWTPGRKDVLRRHEETTLVFTPALPSGVDARQVADWEVAAEVLSTDAEGRARVRWVKTRQRPAATDAAPPLAPEMRGLGTADRYVVEGTVAPEGWVSDVRLLEPASADPKASESLVLESEAAEIGMLMARFPEEPIGVGAVWEVTQTMPMIGMRFQLTSTCVLEEAEEDRLRIQTHFSITAPPQGFDLGGLMGQEMTILSFLATGREDFRLDLDRLLPADRTSSGTLSVAFSVKGEGPTPQTLALEGRMSETATRD